MSILPRSCRAARHHRIPLVLSHLALQQSRGTLLFFIMATRSLPHLKNFMLKKYQTVFCRSPNLIDLLGVSVKIICTEKLIPKYLENHIIKLWPSYLHVGGF